jgi:hypothetical protein
MSKPTETRVGGYLTRTHPNGAVEVLADVVAPTVPRLEIALGAVLAAAGAQVSWTAAIEPPAARHGLTGTWYVPVVRQDGWQGRLLAVALVDGRASGSLTLQVAGIYTLDLARARPVLPFDWAPSPELIVTE